MKDIPLNDFAINILNDTLWFLKDENYKAVHLGAAKHHTKQAADYFTGTEYFEKIVNQKTTHNGFPEICVAYSFGSNGMQFTRGSDQVADEASGVIMKFYEKIMSQLNLKRNALFTVYPPDGYISWHNNANASAYNFIFTYSETGEGYWKHYDPVKKEMVTIPDVKGWQCKAGYFGAYQDGMDKVVYHTARNTGKGLRMTIAFIMDRSEMSSGMQDWVIEDIRAE
jgi:hypothetical protein